VSRFRLVGGMKYGEAIRGEEAKIAMKTEKVESLKETFRVS